MTLSRNTQALIAQFTPYQYSPEDIQKLNSILSATLDWGKSLGLDVKGKLPTIDTIFFFNTDQFRVIAKMEKHRSQCQAFSRPYFRETLLQISGSALERPEPKKTKSRNRSFDIVFQIHLG